MYGLPSEQRFGINSVFKLTTLIIKGFSEQVMPLAYLLCIILYTLGYMHFA